MIETVYIADYEDNYAPPSRVAEVGISGDVVHIAIGKYSTDNNEDRKVQRTFVPDSEIGVPVCELVNAIKIMAQSQARHDLIRALGDDDLRTANL